MLVVNTNPENTVTEWISVIPLILAVQVLLTQLISESAPHGTAGVPSNYALVDTSEP